MQIIDSHLHFFQLGHGHYDWLRAASSPAWLDKDRLVRDFGEPDLQLSAAKQLAGYVHIEAGYNNAQPWQELAMLEQHCQLPYRAVACVDLTQDPNTFRQNLQHLQRHKHLVGVRHIFEEYGEQILLNRHTVINLETLLLADLHFEAQFAFTDHHVVDLFLDVYEHVQGLRVVFNHAGFPPRSEEGLVSWAQTLFEMAQIPYAMIKISGLEMRHPEYLNFELQRVIYESTDCFGELRVMLGSNFPICHIKKSYADYWDSFTYLKDEEAQLLMFENAQRFYGFK